MRGLARYLHDLLGQRRPRRFRAAPEDDAVVRTAIALRAARPGSGQPREAFVEELHERLATQARAVPHGPGLSERRGRTTRRQFVQVASVAATAAAIGAGVDHIVEADGSGPAPTAGATLTPNSGRWQPVLASAELAEGGVKQFELGSVVGFLARSGGQVAAVSGVCTHQACRLAFAAQTRRLNCPCHNASFALTGDVVTHQLKIAPAPLPHLPVREVDGRVEVFAP
ncbi:MAG TPA: Rieske (2Fe-2S) protein [Jatrophihabitantaceae bacterium]|jgi:nitrite reductase/ring-hydroxylating ferredoxin subunit